jgi:hypothetical protein
LISEQPFQWKIDYTETSWRVRSDSFVEPDQGDFWVAVSLRVVLWSGDMSLLVFDVLSMVEGDVFLQDELMLVERMSVFRGERRMVWLYMTALRERVNDAMSLMALRRLVGPRVEVEEEYFEGNHDHACIVSGQIEYTVPNWVSSLTLPISQSV